MAEITENEKRQTENAAMNALVKNCKMNGLDFFSLPDPIKMALLDSFIEGVKFVRDMLPKQV